MMHVFDRVNPCSRLANPREDSTYLELLRSLLSEVRGDTEASVEQRAQSSSFNGGVQTSSEGLCGCGLLL